MSPVHRRLTGARAAVAEEKAREVAELLKVAANPNRLRILCRLEEGECSVAQIEQELGIRQPTLSQQLGELREAALVTTRREHKSVVYSLTDKRTVALLAALNEIFRIRPTSGSAPRSQPAGRGHQDQAAVFGLTGDLA